MPEDTASETLFITPGGDLRLHIHCIAKDVIITREDIVELAKRKMESKEIEMNEIYQRTKQDRFNHPIVCLCGSTRFKQKFIDENARLTREGKIVLTVGVFVHDTTEEITDYEKALLDQLHREKIKIADDVRIINPGGYIGESTAGEIEYAKGLKKPITYMVEPEQVSE
jgi:hypothetical protein